MVCGLVVRNPGPHWAAAHSAKAGFVRGIRLDGPLLHDALNVFSEMRQGPSRLSASNKTFLGHKMVIVTHLNF